MRNHIKNENCSETSIQRYKKTQKLYKKRRKNLDPVKERQSTNLGIERGIAAMGTKDSKVGRERRAESRAKDFAPSVESTATRSQAQHCLISLHTSIAAVRIFDGNTTQIKYSENLNPKKQREREREYWDFLSLPPKSEGERRLKRGRR